MADGSRRHPVEDELNAPAVDILDAINAGFRAKIDVKGKLAELYLARELQNLKDTGQIDDFEWHDKDGKPDFTVHLGDTDVVLECKNVRSPTATELKREARSPRVEIQKTRNSKDGRNTRSYRVTEFDAVGVCLFNQTGEWRFVYAPCAKLARSEKGDDLLAIYHPVPLAPEGIWKGDLLEVLQEAAAAKGGA